MSLRAPALPSRWIPATNAPRGGSVSCRWLIRSAGYKLDVASAERVRARLANFETMTWNEILVQGNKRFHRIATKNICKEAYEKLVELKQEDTDELVSLGLTQVERAWGIKEGSVLKVLWWDPEHMVYPTKPKNT